MALVRAQDAGEADGIDYGHRPLSEQLDAGARQLEIDVYYDPQGGRYADPLALRAAGVALDPARRRLSGRDPPLVPGSSGPRADPAHVQRQGPAPRGRRGGTEAPAFDAAAFDALDAEVRSVFPPSGLVTPDDVQGSYPTLRDAVLAGNWPKLGAARGKVLFALDEPMEKTAAYRGARRSLEGRVFFIDADEASPAAAYMTINDPVRRRRAHPPGRSEGLHRPHARRRRYGRGQDQRYAPPRDGPGVRGAVRLDRLSLARPALPGRL